MKYAYLLFLLLINTVADCQINYCIPTYTYGCGDNDRIVIFQLNTLYNNSGLNCPTGTTLSYTFYTGAANLTTELLPGSNYIAYVTIANGGPGNVGIWMDFNDDGIFSTSEMFSNSAVTPVNGTAQIAVNIPTSAPSGTHRIRVREVYQNYYALIQPCNNYTYGETEDYLITIGNPSSCPALNNVSVTNITSISANINYTCSSCSTVVIEYGINGFTPGTDANAGVGGTVLNGSSPLTINGLQPNTNYAVFARRDCGTEYSANSAVTVFTSGCGAVNVPYSLNFDASTTDLPLCTTKENVNNDASTWMITRATGYTGKTLSYKYNTTNAADDWFYTAGLLLNAGTQYTLGFKYGNNSGYFSEKMKVSYGTIPSAAYMTNVLIDLPNIIGGQPSVASTSFTPTTSGVYYIGFHAYSARDQFYLYLDSIDVAVSPSCLPVTNINFNSVSSTSAVVNWTCNGCTGNYILEYGVHGFTPGIAATAGNGLIHQSNDLSDTINGLEPSTLYDVYVRQQCTPADFSRNKIGSFTTLPCGTPGRLRIDSITPNSVRVAWNCTNCSGDFIIEYGPSSLVPGVNNQPGAGGTVVIANSSPVILNNLQPATRYKIYVRQRCTNNSYSMNTSGVNFITACTAFNVPYLENFDAALTPALPTCTTVENANMDGSTWSTAFVSGYSGKTLSYRWNSYNAANDWFYTAGVNLTAGSNYTISYIYGSKSSTYHEKLRVMYGNAPNHSSMTTLLADHPDITGYNSRVARIDFTPQSDGVYYFGFQAYSAADQLILYLDSIKVDISQAGCRDILNPSVSSTTSNSTMVNWECVGCSGTYSVEYGLHGFIPGTGSAPGAGMVISTSSTQQALINLEPSSVYDIYIRQHCGSGLFSNNQRISVTTLPCPVPTNVIAIASGTTTANVSWNCINCTGPYIVEYGVAGFTPGSGNTSGGNSNVVMATSSPVQLVGLTPGTTYKVYIRQRCATSVFSMNTSGSTFNTQCMAVDIPYVQNFDAASYPLLPNCTSVQDVNQDGSTWATAQAIGYTGNVLRYRWNLANAANDWFFTPGLNLTGGVNYRLTFKYGNNSSFYSEKLKVSYGSGANATSMTNNILDLPSITGSASRVETIDFRPSNSGIYYVGFQAYSAADQFYLYLDSITIELSTIIRPADHAKTINKDVVPENDLMVFPNPVRSYLQIKISSQEVESARLVVSDINGRQLNMQNLVLQKGRENILHINVSNLSSGNYFIMLQTKSGIQYKKFEKL